MKNKIQVLAFVFVVFLGFVGVSNATYKLTGDELKNFNSQKVTISQASDYGLWSYYTQLSKWYDILKKDERLGTISNDLKDYSYSLFESRKNLSKQQYAWEKSKFFDEYSKDINDDIEFPKDKCTGWYNTIDNISFANNFPTALTIAIWYRESNCGYYLPSNGDGPFQIVSKDYGAGEITEQIFKQAVQDFIDFSKGKIDNYNRKADKDFPKIDISYTGFDYTGVINFIALYNGGVRTGGVVQPNAPKYVFDGYGEEYSNASKYGVFPMFLKMLEWETENM